jgi:hypothetical protein
MAIFIVEKLRHRIIHDVNGESATSQVTKAPSLSTLYFICLPFIMFLFIIFFGRMQFAHQL